MARSASRLRLVVPALAALVALPAAAQPAFQVFLASGASVIATSRPLVAMGKVSFLDEKKRPVTLAASLVDVDATKAAAGTAQSSGRVWDEKALTKLKPGKLQFYGEDPGQPKADAEATSDATGEQEPPDVRTPAERLRGEIAALITKINTLPTSDRQRSMLVIRQLELQDELTRLLTSPRRG